MLSGNVVATGTSLSNLSPWKSSLFCFGPLQASALQPTSTVSLIIFETFLLAAIVTPRIEQHRKSPDNTTHF